MNNVFSIDYTTRLREWYNLRERLKNADLTTICTEIDKFWKQVDLAKHYLHPADIVDWPDPWELIYDNEYCIYARALGIIYTFMLLGINDIDLVDGIDYYEQDVCLVVVHHAKYVLNYMNSSTINTTLSDFKSIKTHDITSLKKKIGKE